MDKASAKSLGVTRQDITDLVLGIAGFFMGRIVIFGDINPLGIAYMSTFFLEGKSFYIAALFTLVGILTKVPFASVLKYVICIAFLCGMNFIFAKKVKKRPVLWQSVAAGCAMALSGVVAAMLQGGYVYLMILSVLEGFLTVCCTYLARNGKMVLSGKVKRRPLNSEEMISLSLLAGGLVAGAADIFIGEVSLRYYFCSIIIMAMAYKGGAAMGAASGILMGLVLYATGFESANYAVICAVSGLIAGSVKDMAKQFIAAGYALGNVLMAFYMQSTLIGNEFLFSVLFAGVTFIVIPEKLLFNISSKIGSTVDNTENYIEKYKELTTYKLHGFSKAFGRLGKTFSGLSEKRTSLTQKDVANLIDDAAVRVCAACPKQDYCWRDNFYSTYQTVFGMLDTCEKRGEVETESIPEEFAETCVALNTFSDAVCKVFELYKANLTWHNKIVESRELVSEQLQGISRIIDNLANDLGIEVNFKQDLEQELISELNRSKIDVEHLIVTENKYGKYEVNISIKPCYNRKVCYKDIIPLASRVLGRKMKKDDGACVILKEKDTALCKIRLVEEQKYRLSHAVARAVKDGGKESGDSFSFLELRNGNCIMALSDGMGSGRKARRESEAAIGLLEEFIEAGFDNDTAIKIINSVLLLKSGEESFSTLDICSIDLYTGEAEFVKIGASSTFVCRRDEVSVLRSWSLPVGILNQVDLDITTRQLKDGDIIVMVTDGILDVDIGSENKENWVKEALLDMNMSNPQDIADHIIEQACLRSNEVIGDDMTVLAARFWSGGKE